MTYRIIQCTLSVWFFFAFLAGCTKTAGNPGSPGGSNKNLVKSFETTVTDSILSSTVNQYTTTYNYDNENRQILDFREGNSTYQGVPSIISDTLSFTYGQNTSTETGEVHQDGISVNTIDMGYLNAKGYPDSAISKNTTNTPTIDIKMVYQYDGNGYCTEISNSEDINNGGYLPSGKFLFTITGGNVTQYNSYSANGSLFRTETLTYSGTSNTTVVSPGIPPLTGHLNNNLVQSTAIVTLGKPTSTLNYTYTFDNQNRVTSITAKTPSGKTYLVDSNIQYVN